MGYHVQVDSKNDNTQYWFQNGKLRLWKNIDTSRSFRNSKDFKTVKKLLTFFRWLDATYPDTVVRVLEIQKHGSRKGKWIWFATMGSK